MRTLNEVLRVQDVILDEPFGTDIPHAPPMRFRTLDSSPDGRVERGIWESEPGVIFDKEVDEVFVVVSGRATIDFADGRSFELRPGDIGFLEAGVVTTWTIHERLRKVYQITQPTTQDS